MSKNNNDVMQKLVSAFIIWCMIAVSIVGLFTAQVGGADLQQPLPNLVPGIVDNEIVIIDADGIYNVDYSITVQNGGTLKIIDTTLNFLQDMNNTNSISVSSYGNLILENSTITTAATPQAMWNPLFEININSSGNFSMDDHSVLAFPGWLNVTDAKTSISDSWITSIYPDTLSTAYAEDFPTFYDVYDNWWASTPSDLEDFEDDCPRMIFTDCDNVTIADSVIDNLYEDEDLEDATPFNETFVPTVAVTSPAPVGDVNDLVNQDSQYMNVLAGLGAQILNIDSFDIAGYSDADYQVNNVWVHALYNTSYDGISGYNGTDYVEWRVNGGVYANLFMLAQNSPPWSENYSIPLLPTPSLADIALLDLQFDNTYMNGEGIVLFDQIEIIAELQHYYKYVPTMITLNNTEMTIINSYVGVDWLSFDEDFYIKNAFDITGNSNLYLFNVSIADDEGGLPGKPDFGEIPDDADPALYVPFRTETGSEVYNYRWLKVPVVDKYGAPVEGAYVTAVLNSTNSNNSDMMNTISSINNLTYGKNPFNQSNWVGAWNNSNDRIVNYLADKYGVNNETYNITGANGMVMIPLLTDFFNGTALPNGDFVGTYNIKVNYSRNSIDYIENRTCKFPAYPNSQPEDNLIIIDPVILDGVALPRPGSPGIIVNATTDDMAMDGGAGGELAVTDFIIVEDSATLTVSNAKLKMMDSNDVPFEIIVRDSGTLVLDNVDLITQNNILMDLNLEDSGTLIMTDASSASSIRILAQNSVTITLTRAEIDGSLDIIGNTSAVTVNAWDTKFSRNLDSITGDSMVRLYGCYSPLANYDIKPFDNADVWIYRNIDITVYDGVTPAGTLENVNVTLTNQYASAYDTAGQTGADGHYIDVVLSDYFNSTLDVVTLSHYNGYLLNTEYLTVHDETTGLGLAVFPSFGIRDATYGDDTTDYIEISGSIVLDNVLPDLDPPVNIWPLVNNSVGRGDLVNIGTIINNIGDATANNIDVWFNDTFNGKSTIIYFKTIDTLAPGETFNISFEYEWANADTLGQHNITVTVDPMNRIPEQMPDGEANNYESRFINVTAQPDLAILYYTDVSFSETYSLVDTDFNIMANVYNIGDDNATDVVVSFYDDVNGLLGSVTIANIVPNPTTPVVATLTGISYDTNGSYYIYVVIDEANTIPEVNENNNNNSVSPLSPRYLRIWGNATLDIEVLDIIAGTDIVGYNLGGGVPTISCDFRTMVTLRARVWNRGELHVSNVRVEFWDGGVSLGTSSIVSSIINGNDAYLMITWEATAAGLSEVHTLSARATGTAGIDLTSNIATQILTVNDNRPDLEIDSVGLANGMTDITDSETFPVNVTLTNNGETSSSFNLEIYRSESDYLNTTVARLEQNNSDTSLGRLGNMTIDTLTGGATANYTITCAALTEGDYDLFVVVDLDYNKTDYVTYLGSNYFIQGDIEEYNELNNNATLADVTVILPDLVAVIVLPSYPGNDWVVGETESIIISGRIVRADNTNIGISGISITITLSDGQTISTQSGFGGNFNVNLSAPENVGNYTITVDGTNVRADTAWFEITNQSTSFLWIVIGIILAVIAVIGAITAYLYFVGLGKTVQCGECGAFIPEGAKKCPKCGVEFEDEVAKCSVCGSWVPIDVKNCPDCGTEFTVGTEDLDDYEAKMKRQYDDIVRKFKQEAKDELGAEFTETEFQAWWAAQPSFITFDQWLQEEEEMKRMGSKPCHNCGTENSVTAKICHKCGTVMEADEKSDSNKSVPRKPEGKMPEEKKTAETPEGTPAPAPVDSAGEKKSCPSCSMEVAAHENTCPICNYNFEKPSGGEPPASPPPSGGEGTASVKRVVKKPVKRIVKRPIQKKDQ